jgi:outer membrane lipoprotein SlyB
MKNEMTKFYAVLVAVTFVLGVLTGCKGNEGKVVGGTTGAGLGALLGGAIGGTGSKALLGGAVGAVAGTAIGAAADANKKADPNKKVDKSGS